MACLNDTVTVSLLTGFDQLVRTSGLPLIAAKFAVGALAVVALACSACGSANVPLTSLPGLLGLGSATERAASPAVEMTLAVDEAMYSPATPGTKDPSWAAVPRLSASVAGTVPPGLVCGGAAQPPHAIESRPLTEAPLLVILPVAVSIVTTFDVAPKSLTTPHSVWPSHAKSALETRLPLPFGEPLSLTPLVTVPSETLSTESGPKSPSSAPHSQPLRSKAMPSP